MPFAGELSGLSIYFFHTCPILFQGAELTFFDQMWQLGRDMGMVQWLAVAFSIVYVILAARENIWCWAFGLLGVILSFFVYVDAQLYSDASLQIFYFGMSIYGWVSWSRVVAGDEVDIHTISVTSHLKLLLIGLAGSAILGYFWTYFGAALPYFDAFTTSFSVITTFMVARKILENWLYWIIIDAVCVGVYIHREIYLFAALFVVYTVIAIVGYFAWRRRLAGGAEN